jgi:hypothetical protein
MKFRIVAMLRSVLLATLLAAGQAAYAASPTVKQPQVDTPKRALFVGNSYDYYGKVGKEDAAFLQTVANETVNKFFER